MSKILVIIESPGKKDKIEHILGKNYVVMACYGHIMDLDPNSMSVDIKTISHQIILRIMIRNKS